MTKLTWLSRMPNIEKAQKAQKAQKVKKVKKRAGGANDSDSEGSVDERGNLRGFIEYGSEEEGDESEWVPSYPTYMMVPSFLKQRPTRKAAILARQRMKRLAKKEIHTPLVKRKGVQMMYVPFPVPVSLTSQMDTKKDSEKKKDKEEEDEDEDEEEEERSEGEAQAAGPIF